MFELLDEHDHGSELIHIQKKYNSTLETLDMSRNPCCGPGLEGVRLVTSKS